MTNEFLKEELNIKSMKSQITTPLGKSIKGLMVLLTLLLSGISIAQTTVTLEDQCNCEVLQGTDISAPGAVLPTGADLGDLYVNTNTGTIYYWNGTTWELTSTDANTTNASLTEDGINLILSDSDLNTVSIPLVDIAAVVDTNTTNVTFTVNSTNGTLDIIDSENNIVAVPLGDIAALVNTDNQEGTEVLLTNPLDVDGDSVDETTVEEAIADITAANALDLDIDPTNELTTSGAGAPSSAPANDNPGVTYLDTATNELYVYDGTSWTMVTDNQIAGEVDVTPAGNLTSTDVQSALEELDANSSDNQNLTGASLNGSNELQIDIQRGTPATVDLSSLSETIAAGTGAITVTDDGNGNYTVNSTDTDEDETNELAILAAGVPTTNGTNSGDTYVNTDTGQLYAWNGTTWQKVGGSAAPDADPDPENELSDVSLTGTTLELTNPASGATGVDLNNMFATDQELSDAITASEALDLDKDDQNELQDLEDVLTRNPSAGGIVITDVGTPVNANDAVNKAYVDNLADDDVRVTNTASGNRIATISEPGIAAVDINESVTTLSDADADGVFDYVSENNTTTSFDGTDDQNASQVDLATPIDVDGDTVNETTVEEAIADLAANSSDNQDLELNSSTNILSLTNDASTVDLNSYVNNDTNEIQDLQLTGDNLTLTNDPTATAIDLSDYRETVAGAGDITVTNDSDGNYTVNYVDGDNDSTNELTQRGMGGPTGAPVEGTTYVDTDSGQLYVFDSGTWQPVGGSAVPGDASDTNELITSFGVVGPNLRITEAGDDFDVPLSSLGTDDQDLGLGTNGVANQSVEVTITDGAAALIDIRDADNDPNNENQTVSAGTGISVSQSGDDFAVTNTAPDQTVALTDGGNGNVTIGGTYPNFTIDVPDATVDTDDQDLGLGTNGVANQSVELTITDGAAALIDIRDADSDPNNENQTVSAGTGISVSQSGDDFAVTNTAPDQTVALTDGGNGNVTIGGTYPNFTIDVPNATVDTDEQDLSNTVVTANESVRIDITDGASTTIDIRDADNDPNNENQTVSAGTGISVSQSGDDFAVTNTAPDQTVALTDGGNGNVTIGGTYPNFTIDVPDATVDTNTEYTAGSGLNLASTVFSADVSNTAGNALSIDANGLYVSDTDNDTQYSAGTGLDLTVTEFSVAENGITNTELANDAVQANNILNEAVTLSKLADGNVDGQVMQWDGSNWILVDLGSVTVTENDGVIGNEVVGVTGGNNTLTRSGDGSQAVPYTLAVSADGITNNELADDAVDLANIAAGSASGDLIQWNGTDWEFVAASSLNTDTQYTAGSGLNLAGTVFSADVSNTAGNALSIDANGLYVSNVDNVEDADSDPNNENQTVSAGTGISVSQSGDDFAVTNTAPDQTVALTDGGNGNVTIGGTYPNFTIDVPNATVDTDEQDLSNTVVTANESVRIDITDGASTTIDIRDADNDPNNENQTVSAGTGISVSQSGDDFAVTNTAPDQTVALTDGGNGNVTIGGTYPNFTIDVPNATVDTDEQDLGLGTNGVANQSVEVTITDGAAALIDIRDADNDPNNENQTVSAGTGISVSQSGDDFAVTNTAPDQTVALTDGGNGNVTIGGTYPNFTIDVPDATVDTNTEYTAGSGLNLAGTVFSADVSNTAGNALSIDANGLYVSNVDNVDDADNDPNNENQTVSAGTGISVSQSGDDFAVTNTAPDLTVALTDGGNGNVTIGGTYPNFTIDVPNATVDTDEQDLSNTVVTANESVRIDITDGASTTIDIRDADSDPNNENQTVSAGTGISVSQSGDDFAVTNTAPDQTVVLTDGGNGNVTIGGTYPNFTIDVPDATVDTNTEYTAGSGLNLAGTVFSADVSNTAGNALSIDANGLYVSNVDNVDDADSDPNNENQTVSAGTGISVSQSGDDFAVTNTAPDQTVALTDGGNGNVTIGGTYPNFTIDVPNATVDTDEQDLSNTVVTANESVRIDITDGASTTIDIRDADNDPNNENQTVSAGTGISVSQSGDDFAVTNTAPDQTVALTDGGNGNVTIGGTYPNFTIDVPNATVDTDEQDLSNTVVTANESVRIDITDGASTTIDIRDADNDPNNENQTVSAGTGISVSQSGDDFAVTNTAPDQTVALTDGGNGNVTIGGTYPNFTIDVPDATVDTNTEYTAGSGLNLAGTVFSADVSNTAGNALSIDANGLYVSNVDNVDDADSDPNNENQTVSAGTGISVSQSGDDFAVTNTAPDQTVALTDGGNGNVTIGGTYPNFTIDVPNATVDTDEQDLGLGTNGVANQSVELTITDGAAALIDIRDADNDPNNENQTVSAGTGISVSQSGDDFAVTNTAPDQTVALTDGGNGNVTIGGTYPNFTIDVPDATVDTDDQTLSLTGNILAISEGNSVNLSGYENTDDQTLSLTGNTLEIANGNSVNLSGYENTDDQTLSLTGTDLTIDGGNTIDISGIDTDTDDQTLSISGDQLSISEGNSVTIPSPNGAETIVEAAPNSDISVSGTGTSANPYVIANTRPDIFYPPSIAVDVSSTGNNRTINLHAEYLAQYGTPEVRSAGAPAAIPTYANTELYYYVTYYDPTVFANVTVNASGIMQYDVIASPTDYNTLINVVFVAK